VYLFGTSICSALSFDDAIEVLTSEKLQLSGLLYRGPSNEPEPFAVFIGHRCDSGDAARIIASSSIDFVPFQECAASLLGIACVAFKAVEGRVSSCFEVS
jgi:hypothetical protein